MIHFSNLHKTYRQFSVLSDVSGDFPRGQVTAIIGPNGAGKSTLLSVVCRLAKADSGDIEIAGQRLESWDQNALAKRLSVLRQSNQINMRFTVRELVAFGRFPHCQGRLKAQDHQAIDEALALLELTHLSERYLDELSGGQRQMAFIAMTVAQQTDYLFLDEPLNNLDIKHSVAMMRCLQRLAHAQNKAVVIVIHDINFAARYADRLIAMKNGKIAQMGSTQEVIQSEILSDIYEVPFVVTEHQGAPLCVYY
ncbi:iron ABC transporter ATP-binding protein [Vibrio stylophorae]|nr:ATP-binding cassette domain-containing protein [Vibrio stylophorae]